MDDWEKLTKVIQAVLRLHRPSNAEFVSAPVCDICMSRFPCATVKAMTDVLNEVSV